jgi:tetratricopeptide (TPR) repeat protein
MGANRIVICLLAAMCAAGSVWPAGAQQACDVEEAQRLFGQRPRPTAQVQRLLEACQDSRDWRVPLFLGVMAREDGDREAAVEQLRRARVLDPNALPPVLELALTLEVVDEDEAASIYRDVLARDPNSKPAQLGLARVARSQSRLDDAEAIYRKMLAANAQDTDALNGLAWVALQRRDRLEGQQGFRRVLAIDPNNKEASVGLIGSRGVYRYLFDAEGGVVTNSLGTSWGMGARGLAGVTPFDSIEVGITHFTEEMAVASATGVSVLPSEDIRLGFHRLVPLNYAVSFTYDYRTHRSLPAEHWLEGSAALYLSDEVRVFVGYRQILGAPQWNSRLLKGGIGISLDESFEVTGTVFTSGQAIFNNYQDVWSWVIDVYYHGPNGLLLGAGYGYAPLINNLDLHAQAIVPVTDRWALKGSVAYNSTNYDTRAWLGLRFTW